jgi:hypothetical protein
MDSDPLVAALRRLVAREGGTTVVADRIGANDQSLYQIVAGVKPKAMKKPKSVGPQLRARLTEAYPDWMTPAEPTAAASSPGQARPTPSPGSRTTPPTLATALPVVLDAIAQADNVTRPAVVAALHRAIDDPSQLELTLQLLERLQAASAPPAPRVANG